MRHATSHITTLSGIVVCSKFEEFNLGFRFGDDVDFSIEALVTMAAAREMKPKSMRTTGWIGDIGGDFGDSEKACIHDGLGWC